jgi:hypothetical protein
MSGMTCTRCLQPAGDAPDLSDLSPELIGELCRSWLCGGCLDEVEEAEAEQSEPSS